MLQVLLACKLAKNQLSFIGVIFLRRLLNKMVQSVERKKWKSKSRFSTNSDYMLIIARFFFRKSLIFLSYYTLHILQT